MDRSGLPIAAGTINIIAGFFNLIGCLGVAFWLIGFVFKAPVNWHGSLALGEWGIKNITLFLGIAAVWLLIAGILAIIGGAFAVQRKHWGTALTGSIFVLLTNWPLGIASLVLTIVSAGEFRRKEYGKLTPQADSADNPDETMMG
jgi:hypothetical protein